LSLLLSHLIFLLLLPLLIMGWGNRHGSVPSTALRFLLVVILVWIYIILTRIHLADAETAAARSIEELQAIYDGDGAKNAFAAVFGWVAGVFAATLAWGFCRMRRWLEDRWGART
jgi:glycerol uptake facilitator-like aquaporin